MKSKGAWILVSALLAGCGTTAVNEGAQGPQRGPHLTAVVGETRVVYYPSERQGETRFSAHDAEWIGGEAVAAYVASYQAERGALPCNSARVAESEDSGESARNRWIETWTINLCGSDYRVPVHGEKSFLKTSYEVGTAQRIPGPQRQAFEPEYGEPSTTVSAYNANSDAPMTAFPVSSTQTQQQSDPRYELLPLELRDMVRKMAPAERELYFRQYAQ